MGFFLHLMNKKGQKTINISWKKYEINSSKLYGAPSEVYNLLIPKLAQRGWKIVFKGVVANVATVVVAVVALVYFVFFYPTMLQEKAKK